MLKRLLFENVPRKLNHIFHLTNKLIIYKFKRNVYNFDEKFHKEKESFFLKRPSQIKLTKMI